MMSDFLLFISIFLEKKVYWENDVSKSFSVAFTVAQKPAVGFFSFGSGRLLKLFAELSDFDEW